MTNKFAGKRILIVEDEQMIAENLAFEITAERAEVIGPVTTADAALDAIANTHLDGATLDIKLKGVKTFQVADVLAARDIPFVFLTDTVLRIFQLNTRTCHAAKNPQRQTPFAAPSKQFFRRCPGSMI